MKMPSVMRGSGRFARVPAAEIQRSQFNRSHGHKTTFDEGYLVPIYWDEVLPGDTFNLDLTAFCRLSTPVKPIMDNLWLETFFFFVPNRLLWEKWQRFCGEQNDPGDSIAFTVPQVTPPAAGYTADKLQDYLGLPTGVGTGTTGWTHSALPSRAYYLIWNEWFRDQNLQDSVSQRGISGTGFAADDGPDASPTGGMTLRRRGKRHDYFTSCLPWAQKEDAVDVPLGDVVTDGQNFRMVGMTSSTVGVLEATTSADPSAVRINASSGTFTAGEGLEYNDQGLQIETPTINELREAFQIQRLLERDARSGTRYPEILMAHFGVQDPSMLVQQRPEYLGGGSSAVVVNPVAQTSETNTTEQGNLAGIGTAVVERHGFVKSFTEHGIVMGLVSVRADLNYQEGLERALSRSTRYDFYWPAFANLGEQAVYNKELCLEDHADDELAFGYQERWAEYRYKQSRITGEFRSSHASTLEVWHLAQDYAGTCPDLDSDFIEENADMDRILASTSNHHFLFDGYFRLVCARPMPMYSVPGLIDHF